MDPCRARPPRTFPDVGCAHARAAIPDRGLGHLSTLIVDDATGAAAVVDPRRDVDVYLEAAERDDLRIEQVIETHLHNDYVSGGRELAALTGATHVIGVGADLRYDARGVRGGDTIEVGGLRLTVLDTPGHTPESVSYTLADTTRADEPLLMLTGGSLLVGAVGRTDLLGAERGAGLLGGDVSLAPRRDPAPRGLGRDLPDPRCRLAVLDRDRLHDLVDDRLRAAPRPAARPDGGRRLRPRPAPRPARLPALLRPDATDQPGRPAPARRRPAGHPADAGRRGRRRSWPMAASSSTPAGPTRTRPVISRARSRSRSAARSGRGSAGSRTTIDRSCSSWTTPRTSTSCSDRPIGSATNRSSACWTAGSTPGAPPASPSSDVRSMTATDLAARLRGGTRRPPLRHRRPPARRVRRRPRAGGGPHRRRVPSPTVSASCRATGRSP